MKFKSQGLTFAVCLDSVVSGWGGSPGWAQVGVRPAEQNGDGFWVGMLRVAARFISVI